MTATPLPRRRTRVALWTALAVALVLVFIAALFVNRRGRLPGVGSPTYESFTRAFYHGLASLEVGLLDDAKRDFSRAAEIVPAEPAAWANLGLAEIRLGEFDAAAMPIQRAASLVPNNSDVEFLFGQLETSRGRLDEGIAHLRRAVDLDPQSLRPRSALAQEIERAAGQNADAQTQQLFEELLRLRPDNLAVIIERARLAAKRGDTGTLQDSVTRLQKYRDTWPAVAMEQYDTLAGAVAAQSMTEAGRSVLFLRNVLVRVPAFRENLREIRVASEVIAEAFDHYLALPSPTPNPSAPDAALTFAQEAMSVERSNGWGALLAFAPDETSGPVVVAADGHQVLRIGGSANAMPFPGGTSFAPPRANGIVALDWSRDFKTDLALAGRGGVRLFVQADAATFVDRTAEAGLNLPAVNADCSGIWTADLEMDGDLDLVVGINGGDPAVLRNNGDGTWRSLQPFPGVVGLQAFAWGDLDGDGDPDAALLDASGNLHLFENRQGGEFRRMAGPPDLGQLVAFTLGDANGDGVLDLVTLDRNGSIRRSSRAGANWTQHALADWPDRPSAAMPGDARLFLADLDNNGALDIVASGGGRSRLWLGAGGDDFKPLAVAPDADIFSVTDLNGDGQLDFVALVGGQPSQLMGRGTKGYHWQVIRPRAQQTAGDQRINSFGVGGEIQIRSGLLTQKQLLVGGPAHFGLGTRSSIDVARILWPNGVVQADFDTAVDREVVAEQRLKGSCPWVFAFDGTGMRFVTDFLWRSPLGLRINAQDTAGITQTEDWVKIRGNQLVPRDGAYDVRITAELWETHFIDHVALLAVDHPSQIDVFVDERFAKEPPALAVKAVKTPVAVAHAWDESGRDVTELVAKQDGRYLTTFRLGQYQGIGQDHFVEVDLGRTLPPDRRVWLLANGWIYPTDSSINVAIGQGSAVHPRGLALEAQDEAGRWIVVAPDVGFPAGKNKTILLDLGAVARAGIAHVQRIRLRTNLEIYWDWMATAESADAAQVKTMRLMPDRADLSYRGFSRTAADVFIERAGGPREAAREEWLKRPPGPPDVASGRGNRAGPEVPLYDRLANVVPRWRDLVGYYTRFGDVRELLTNVDDRYVIMNAGDELRLSFPAQAPPPSGWTRDFVLVGDGWEKDGDYNTTYSKTVGPLPSHAQPNYGARGQSTDLEHDPVYRRYPQDWQTYHTRFVAPDDFVTGLGRRPQRTPEVTEISATESPSH